MQHLTPFSATRGGDTACSQITLSSFVDNNDDYAKSDNNIICVLTAALSPNIDSYVFVKIVNEVTGIVIEEESGDAGYKILSDFGQFSVSTYITTKVHCSITNSVVTNLSKKSVTCMFWLRTFSLCNLSFFEIFLCFIIFEYSFFVLPFLIIEKYALISCAIPAVLQ